MQSETTPCIVCGKILYREIEDYELQPGDGVMFSSSGNYGSTVYDPMDGSSIYINICDPCLVSKGTERRVKEMVNAIPVVTDTVFPGDEKYPSRIIQSIVGWMQVDRPAIYWLKDLPPHGEQLYMPVEDILENLDNKKYKWNLAREGFLHMLDENETFWASQV